MYLHFAAKSRGGFKNVKRETRYTQGKDIRTRGYCDVFTKNKHLWISWAVHLSLRMTMGLLQCTSRICPRWFMSRYSGNFAGSWTCCRSTTWTQSIKGARPHQRALFMMLRMFTAAGKVSFRRAESTALCVKESWTDEGRGSSEYVKISERFLVWRGDNNKHPQTAEETWKTEKNTSPGLRIMIRIGRHWLHQCSQPQADMFLVLLPPAPACLPAAAVNIRGSSNKVHKNKCMQ